VLGLPAARKYASIAPASAHALHMPSHIFTRLGIWDECITSNLASVASAKCYAEAAGIKGHWDEELHGIDYLVYAYLQKAENDSAKRQVDYLATIKAVSPVNFKVAYAFAAIPARFPLENNDWKQASTLKLTDGIVPWEAFPWQEAIVHFARALGSAHTNKLKEARAELKILKRLHDSLVTKDPYQANQVLIQIHSAEAWLRLKEGKQAEALRLMNLAADLEDKTGKHPVTPGEVIPARELLGNLLLEINEPVKALKAFEVNLRVHPNRFNALYGAGLAAEKSGNAEKAKLYYGHLLTIVGKSASQRVEITRAKNFLNQ
jgi:tetratricopeptide (TPR) repeat protein